MNEKFIAERLLQLRQQKGCSARDMSISIGQNPNYINHIENCKMFPSAKVFFYICEYLNITPLQFFDVGNSCPEQLNEVMEDLKGLDEKSLSYIAGIAKSLSKKDSKRTV